MTQNKEQIIADMLENGLLSDEDAKRYLADESVNASDMNEIKQMIELCKERAKSNSKSYTLEEIEKKIRKKYFNNHSNESMTDSVSVGDNYSKEEQEAIEDIIRRGKDDIKNGRVYTEEEFYKEIGLDLSLSPKSQTLKELLSRGDITKDEYEKYLSDDNFSDADAEDLKEEYDAIRDCEDDIKNGRLYSEEEAIKRIKEA